MEFLQFKDDIYFIKFKALIMKKFISLLIASIQISVTVFAQSSGDYRSIGSGNWNDPTKWKTYNGSSWLSATTYPGQNPGTGKVTIITETEIKITQSLPHPIASLLVDLSWVDGYHYGILTFSAESAVSLNVTGDVVIPGKGRIDNLNGAKTHWLSLGGNFEVGQAFWGENGNWEPQSEESLQAINQDDKLGISFNTTNPNSQVRGPYGISFQDIIFNGIGIVVSTPIRILGTVTFVNGIITSDGYYCPNGCGDYQDMYWLPQSSGGSIFLEDDATVTGASNASFVDGYVWKQGHGSFTFPIGDEGIYSPLAITAPAEHQSFVAARYVKSSGAAGSPISDPGLYSVSNCEYWNLSIEGPIDVTVGWNATSGCGPTPYITNVSDVKLAFKHWDSDSWGSHGGIATGTTTNGSVTLNVRTNAAAITLGNVGTSCLTPNGLSSTNIGTNTATVSWSAAAGATSYDVDYRLANSGEWINAATATTSTSVGLTGLTYLVSYYWRVRANCSLESSSYRQAQFTTITDCGTPSGISTTNITSNSATLSWAAVPNAINYDVQYTRNTYWYTAVAGTTSLSFNLTGLYGITPYQWRVRANCSTSSSLYIGAQFQTLHPCGIPSGLSTTNITSSSARLSWVGAPNSTNSYVEYKQSTASTWMLIGLASPPYSLVGLSASTAYDWRVYTLCSDNYSTYVGHSANASFTTTIAVCNDLYETNNTSTQAKTISIGSTISAGISSATDIDWFKVTTPNFSFTNLQVDLMNLPADYDLYIYNKSLKLIASSINSGTSNEVVVYNSNARKTTYYIKVIPKSGAFNSSQCYTLLAQAVSSGNRTASHASAPVNEVTENTHKQFLYPNPASEFVYLNFNSATEGLVNIQIINSIGQLVKQHPVNTIKGYNQFKIQIADIRPGMYILRINKGDLNLTRKFVIAR